MNKLDFLIIGAQKCATTTLFEHLRGHPEINLPLEKELPFFTEDDISDPAWNSFSEAQFGPDDQRLRGKVTPQYMCDTSTAQAIHDRFPNIKLVAILRDPIERTWSHYQMAKRRETESRSFAQTVDQLLQSDAAEKNRTLPVPSHDNGYEPESDFYVAWSEYGRILQHYAEVFGPEQLLVLYTEDLQADPAGTLDRLLAFIGLETGYRPESLGEVVHRGGGSKLIPHGFRVWLRNRRLLYSAWNLIPESRRGRLRFLYEQWNIRKGDTGEQLPEDARLALQSHYAADLNLLHKLPVTSPPWADRYSLA